jgi:hypothetical protein
MTSRFVKPVAGALAVLLLLFAFGFRWGHPKDGLTNALGSAKSTIVIYHKTSSVTVGSKVISAVDAPGQGPVIAIVNAASGENVDLQAGAKLVRVKSSQISGKLLAVVPFIGSLLSVVGL